MAVVAVEAVAEALDVDIGGADAVLQSTQAVLRHKSVAHQQAAQAAVHGQACRGVDQLEKNCGFIVGKGHAGRAVFARQGHQVFGHGPLAGYAAIGGQLGNAVVLAEATGKIAACAACGKGARAGQKMVERLFFHGVEAHGGDHIAHQRNHAPIAVDPHAAKALFARFEATGLGAEAANHGFVRSAFPKQCLHIFLLHAGGYCRREPWGGGRWRVDDHGRRSSCWLGPL